MSAFVQLTVDSKEGQAITATSYIFPSKSVYGLKTYGTGVKFSLRSDRKASMDKLFTATEAYADASADLALAATAPGVSIALAAADVAQVDGVAYTGGNPIVIKSEDILYCYDKGGQTAIRVREANGRDESVGMVRDYLITTGIAAVKTILQP